VSTELGVKLISSGQAGKRLGKDSFTIVRWAVSGRLLSVRTLGGHYRLFAAEVDALARGEAPEAARELALAEQARLSVVSDARRPVHLSFPAYDIGAADIMADGKNAGICLDEGQRRWRAYLYPALSVSRIRVDRCEEVTAGTLGELRRALRKRVADEGPWWR
jgi:hypothetical protein